MADPVTTPETTTPEAPLDASNPELMAAVEKSIAGVNAAEPSQEPAAATPGADTEQEPAAAAEPVTEPADTAAAAPVADPATETAAAAPAPGARPSDEFGTLDERTSEKTRERFETMKTRFDSLASERDEAVGLAKQWVDTVSSTGATPEQFTASLQYLHLVNRGDRASLEQAHKIMRGEYETLSKALGYPMEGFDPLEAHADLKTRVDDGELDRDTALELARYRSGGKIDQVVQQQQQTVAATQQEHADGVKSLHDLGARLRATDPAFALKQGVMKPIIDAVVASRTPPSQWARIVEKAYRDVALPAAAMASAPRPAAKTPTPMRPGGAGPGSGNGLDREPQTALDAVNRALGRA